MCSSKSTWLTCCGKKTGALCVAIYKSIFVITAIILVSVAIDMYLEEPVGDEKEVRIHRVVLGALIATVPLCALLLLLHIMLLWATIKKRASPIKWWIRLTVVVEVLTCSSMFMVEWDTLRSVCLLLNFFLNIFLLRVVCSYERSLKEDEKDSMTTEIATAESGNLPTPSTSLM